MKETLRCPENGEQITESCAIPLPKGDENTIRLATRYAWVFSQTLQKEQYVVLGKVSAPLGQAISLGAWMAGHPVAYINPAYTKLQLNDVLTQLGTSLKIGRPDCITHLETQNIWLSPDPEGKGNNNLFDLLPKHKGEGPIVPHEWRNDECAAVLFTSGSTGKPKGVCHSIGNLTRSAELFIRQFSIKPTDRLLNLAPLHVASGVRSSILVPLMSGCQLIDSPKEPTLEDVLNIYRSERPTVFISGPIMFRQLALLTEKLDDELSSIRILLSTGAKLDRNSRVRLWETKRIPVLDYYGLTEAIFAIGEHVDQYQPELDTIGKPFPGITVDLTEVKGISDPELTLGQIRVYSPNIFLGYLGEPLRRRPYFDTGDLGKRDQPGNISLKGRLDQGVKASSTLWLFPQALEQLLVHRSDIADAYVRSGYDSYDRGVLYAKVVPAKPEAVDDGWIATLRQDIEDQLGPDYKAVELKIAREIPRSPLGKVLQDKGAL